MENHTSFGNLNAAITPTKLLVKRFLFLLCFAVAQNGCHSTFNKSPKAQPDVCELRLSVIFNILLCMQTL